MRKGEGAEAKWQLDEDEVAGLALSWCRSCRNHVAGLGLRDSKERRCCVGHGFCASVVTMQSPLAPREGTSGS